MRGIRLIRLLLSPAWQVLDLDYTPGNIILPVSDPAEQTTHLKTVQQGAATSVWCAVSGQLAGRSGVYCEAT